MYELVPHANCTVVHILEPQTFLILWSAGFEQLECRKNRPVTSQFPIKRNLWTVEYACFDWLYDLVRVPAEE